MMTPETSIKNQIRDYLRLKKWYVRSIPSNEFSRKGNPDYYAVKDGVVLFIEVKSEKGKMSKEQLETQDEISSHGGHYIIARSVEDIINYLRFQEDNA